ncbi:MAG TPA: acyl-CoA thioesterase [Burkholderiaceae bacterium]|jgi:4-hydroxybenzoyl-CoA thioesterase|nr:acyl-CoA thioesterase [Burkholderiaceae bacterium]
MPNDEASDPAAASAQSRTSVYTVSVEFGDCDPAGIVWFPNFFRWIDAASRHFFIDCGVPRWAELELAIGVVGTPIVETKARFLRSASYGDRLEIHTTVAAWREKSFVQRHRLMRDGELLMECDEVRVFAARRKEGGIRAVPIPLSVIEQCRAGDEDSAATPRTF